MSVIEAVPLPAWVTTSESKEHRANARLCFLIRLAALYHNDRGSLGALSMAAGLSETALTMALKRGLISAEHAVAVERVIGRALFPRELFRPDLFTLPGE